MLSINRVYDGKKIKPLKNIPFKEKKKVVITFLDEVVEDNNFDSNIDPIEALRGCAKESNLIERMLEDRRKDKDLEFEQIENKIKVLKLPYK